MEEKVLTKNDTQEYNPAEIAEELSLELLEQEFSRVEKELEAAEVERKILREAILIKMDKKFGHYPKSWTNPDTGGTLIRTMPVRTIINQRLMKRILTQAQYAVVTETKVDLDLLKSAIDSKTVDPKKIAKALSEKVGNTLSWYPPKR